MDPVNDTPNRATDGRADPLIGRVLDGRYRILTMIAKGGMGRIYKAEQQPLNRIVALKVLSVPPTDAGRGEDFRQRFYREASICSKLTHPNTVRIFDYGKSDDGIYFIAMEFLEGRTMRQILADEAPIAPWRVIDLLKQICSSLAEAHSMGLIHRDLKPSNVIITTHADGTEFVNVVDFGLVKDLEGAFGDGEQTQAGLIVGSPMYMSPEQILQGELTERSDIYSLGVIMYGALTGRKPFKQESALALMNCHINVPPPPFAEINPELEVSANLEWVVMTCLAKDPKGRFASVQELSRALSACDKELRGMVTGLQLEIQEGRVILPLELEEHLSRRPAGSSGPYSGSLTLNRPMQVEPPPPRRVGLYVGLGALALLLFIGAAVLVLVAGTDTPPEATPAATVAPAPVEPAPPVEPSPPDGAAADTPAVPTPAPPPQDKPAATPRPADKPVARPADTPVTKPADKPTAAQPADVPAEPPAEPDKPVAEGTDKTDPPPDPGAGDDWGKPQSDIRNPWED
ncbi:MAG: protein kinase [Alphaproteobacteria bacterium]|nr:protein kinase [Alphaproteobacteria bacterium]